MTAAFSPARRATQIKQDHLRQIRGMQHRRPDPHCPLCLIWGIRFDPEDRETWGRQHAHAAALWAEWDGRKDWPERVALAAGDILGVEVDAEQARQHFTRHRVEQPHPPGKLDRRQALAGAAMLSAQAQAILSALYRQRLLSRQQIIDLFYGGHPKRSAGTLADRELNYLAHHHFIYRLYPDPAWENTSGFPKSLVKEVFYLFGRSGVPYIESRYGIRVWNDSFTTMARQVGRTSFVHDWRANSVYCAFERALRERGEVLALPGGGETRGYTLKENWYGARMIGMRMWSRRLMRELDMRPDGFATLSLERSGFSDTSLPSTQLPFFYEFDNETKQPHVVAEQMLNYHHLALAGEAGRRFPDLSLEGYAVPMIMVFRGHGRVEEVARSFRRRAHREGYRQGGAPIFMAREDDWMKDPFTPGILRLAWDEGDEPLSLVDALLRSSARLLETRALTATQVLELDPTPSPRRQAAKDAAERAARQKGQPQAGKARPVRPPTDARAIEARAPLPAPAVVPIQDVQKTPPARPGSSQARSAGLTVDPLEAMRDEPIERRRRRSGS